MRVRINGPLNDSYLDDPSITFKAKGILSFLIYLRDRDDFKLKDLKGSVSDGDYSFNQGIKELVSAGYLVKHNYVSNKWEYILNLSKN